MKKLLVANRGEIARRIFRACRLRGIATVAVYSEADREAAHVAEADEAHPIGPAPARESYLVAERILDVARRAGVDAVHPGYGFLSENAAFAQQVTAQGLTWVGPAASSIVQMGDKQKAREIAQAAGVPVVPGSHASGDLAAEAGKVGFPLLVKAAAGGGGIGMRRVDRADQLASVLESTRSMAGKAFGNDAVYLERYVAQARHVEVQVFGFGNGEAIHLMERDCSLQRRFQKVIEESPAPDLPTAVRNRMAEAAVKLCGATRYAGAGTVEFIVDALTHEFFFLEMNTRIQVEHPVTEAVTGRDLVGMQLDFAAGLLATLLVEPVMDPVQGPVQTPLEEIPINRAARRKILRQVAPLASRAQHVQDGVERLPHVRRAPATSAPRRRNERLDARPLLVRQVARVAQMVSLVPSSVVLRPHRRPHKSVRPP